MNALSFRDVFSIVHNLDLSDLEQAGVINPGANCGSDWRRFNDDFGTFVLKLPSARLDKLIGLIEARRPKATPVAVTFFDFEDRSGEAC
ncbi:hypothetical protein HKB47_22785 [Mesorhizobium japonicum]|nr:MULTISPECIES: hypothetical protein [Mesorhizobium]ETA72304.1 hypothetical protein MesloDRAFT_1172 [Mesorhizobium japonicum R7A]MBE1709636.1 hypothetical protein [Mesorhizobium japonicum]MUT25286.1 hypothetical protein [Mesorhizobium japonicum]MUT28660.1 hypothetical protein [Mesorhizobium japonicum]PBB11158.1 hypothetical protein CK231_26000 [Mesorhizobium loti]